jgi:hypothetical protein
MRYSGIIPELRYFKKEANYMDIQEILRDYSSDLMAVEKHCLESIERQTQDDKFMPYTDAYALLSKIESTLRTHTFALDQYLASIDGGAESLVKKAATSAIGAIAGLYGKFRSEDPISRSLRDDYTALSLVAISCTMLHTTARALNELVLAELALKHLNDITPFIVALSRVIPSVVAKELADEGKVTDPYAWQAALDSTQKAWSSNVVEKFH